MAWNFVALGHSGRPRATTVAPRERPGGARKRCTSLVPRRYNGGTKSILPPQRVKTDFAEIVSLWWECYDSGPLWTKRATKKFVPRAIFLGTKPARGRRGHIRTFVMSEETVETLCTPPGAITSDQVERSIKIFDGLSGQFWILFADFLVHKINVREMGSAW